jgi:hypothetical protein
MTPAVPHAHEALVSVRPVEGDVRQAIRSALEDVGWTETDQVLENIDRAGKRRGVRATCRGLGVTWVNMSTLVASRRAWRVALSHPLYGSQWRRRP